MKIALVAICKNEDKYIDEWVDYHYKLGFDSIFVYENDWCCTNKNVIRISYNGLNKQVEAYNSFIKNYQNEYDWAAFLDVDEFLVLKKHNNVKSFIENYKEESAIGINWILFGDNNLKEPVNNEFSLLKRFTKRQKKIDNHIKSIVKISSCTVMAIHNPEKVQISDPNNNIFYGHHNKNGDDSIAQINHYFCKTFPEFLEKISRGRADIPELRTINDFDSNNYNEVADFTAHDFFFKRPHVSIIIPNYNHASYLRERIDSVLAQTFQDFEIIILDDASKDNSTEIIEVYRSDPRIRIEFNSVNSGCVFKQWNKGLRLACGDYIWIAESDDYASPKYLETLLRVMEKNPNVGVAFCDSFRVHGEEVTRARERWFGEFAPLYEDDFITNGPDYVSTQMLFFNTIPNASSALFRRTLAMQIGGADESFLLSGDWLFWIQLLRFSDIAYVAEPFNFYRYHEQTARHANLSNGVMIEDALRISTFVLENFSISLVNAEIIKERLSSWYIDIILNNKELIPLSRQRSMKYFAAKLNPKISLRIWLRITGISWVMLGIINKINYFICKR